MQEQRKMLEEAFRQTLQEKVWEGSRRWKSIVEEVGLTEGQAMVLKALGKRNETCSMRELSELSQQSGAVLTGVIDRLLKLNLVIRQADARDRRVVMIALTTQGKERLAELEALDRSKITEDLQAFSDADVQQFISLLQKFSQGIRRSMSGTAPLAQPESPC